jgi:DNA-binding MarR family transcriptional regulator
MRSPRPADFYSPRDYGAQDSVGYLMRRLVAAIRQDVDRRLDAVGLTNAQWVPLLKLKLAGALPVAELARGCEVDAGAMTRMLDRLEAKGLVHRVRSAADRRVVTIELTADGKRAAAGIPAVLCEVQNGLLAGVSREEWQALVATLHKMLANAAASQDDGA